MPEWDIKSLTLAELGETLAALNEPSYRAKQLYLWMHQKLAASYEQMTDLPLKLRTKFESDFPLTALQLIDRKISKEDGTEKYLFALSDGNVIESVLMRYHHGNSVCISSQVGCRMGCSFCASAIGGLKRNLTPSEMLDQVYRIQCITKERVSNVVVMGTGEPLDNYGNLLRFLQLISDENGLHISQRNITVSSCGLTEKIRSLASERLRINLALSLHAATQKKREELMPIARKYELGTVIDSCRFYAEETGRRITYEYSLIRGVNDSPKDARDLAALLEGQNCLINLILVNPIKERGYVQPKAADVAGFKKILDKCGKNVTIRREMGRDIGGACGQLRRSYLALGEKERNKV